MDVSVGSPFAVAAVIHEAHAPTGQVSPTQRVMLLLAMWGLETGRNEMGEVTVGVGETAPHC